jgi:crotonobetainyl-CoA:carnitine CoA-transferase CaiB-like acyl-CoA transferase
MLADLGARVIKIEGLKGDGFRQSTPLVGASGSYFQILNRNKQGMCLNLKEQEGRSILREMARKADVFLESCRPGTMDSIGLGYGDLAALNPRLIYCSLTGFGQDGPYRDRVTHDINLTALAGVLELLGDERGKPPVPSIQIAGAGGGSFVAMIGILAALIGRMQSGRGQYLDVALLDGLTPFMSLAMSQHLAGAELSPEEKNRLKGGYASYNIYMTGDERYLAVGCLEESTWREFCEAIGRPDFVPDLHAPPERQAQMKSLLEGIFRQKARAEWMDIFERFSTCVSPVNNLEEAANDPQVRARGLWFKGLHPADGEVPQQAFPIKYRENRPGWRSHPPSLGEHTEEILREFGFDEARISDLRQRGIIL